MIDILESTGIPAHDYGDAEHDWDLAALDAAAARNREARDAELDRRAAEQEARGGVLVRTNGGAILRYTPGQEAAPSRFPRPSMNEPRPGVFVRRTAQDTVATPAQMNYLTSLLASRLPELSAEAKAKIAATASASKQICSEMIDNLVSAPVAARPQTFSPAGVSPSAPALPDVPEGRYAVENADGTLRFYSVDRPTEGRWAGFTFLAVWASDETFPIKNRETKAQILAEIARDPKAAMLRFGMEIGKCGHCGRTLTDAASRAAGIGPVCAGKVSF